MFYNLLTQYKIGGKFLKILKNIYTDNQMFVKVDGGLSRSFVTTKTGVYILPFIVQFLHKQTARSL